MIRSGERRTGAGSPLRLLALLAVAGLGGCAEEIAVPPLVEVVSLTLDHESVTVAVGEAARIQATARDAMGNVVAAAVSWSSESGIVHVSDRGVVTGLAVGSTLVVARVGARVATASVRVIPDVRVRSIAASRSAVCAVTKEGELYCAGDRYGPRSLPVALEIRWREVTGFGEHQGSASGFCGIAVDDRAYCWGSNRMGQLGVGDRDDRAEPTPVAGDFRFRHLSAGDHHTCGVTVEGSGYCWGDGGRGALGDGTDRVVTEPVRVRLDARLVQISAGFGFTCALTDQNRLYCWGRNGTGQVGDGRVPMDSNLPRSIAPGVSFRSLNRGNTLFACALTPDGEAYCWGNTNPMRLAGQECPFAGGTTHPCWPVPTPHASGFRFLMLTANAFGGMCGLTSAHQVACWGINLFERFGAEPSACAEGCADPRPGPSGFVSLAGSVYTNCGITAEGRASCWGDNRYGQLGEEGREPRSRPVRFVIEPLRPR